MSKGRKRLKIIIPVAATALVAAALALFFLIRGGAFAPGAVSVEYVSVITGVDGGLRNRYAGVVEPQASLELWLDPSRSLAEIYVEAGEQVRDGQPLFAYATEDLTLSLDQMSLDIQRTENTISSTNTQIDLLKKQRDKAAASLQLEYTTQIQSYEAQVKLEEYNLRLKKLEMERIQEQIDNSVVCSALDGTVSSINESLAASSSSPDRPFMSIVAGGEYRVRGNINEQNIAGLVDGAAILVRSRLDGEAVWRGVLDYVDTLSPIEPSDYYGWGMMDETARSTKYPFYVSLESSEGLMLGQHVYIEPDLGEMSRNGLWLLEYYIVRDDGEFPYAWAVNKDKDKIEKRAVSLGRYDPDLQLYEITAGLELTDEIAWPSGDIRAGMNVVRGSWAAELDQSAPFATEIPDETEKIPEESEAPRVTTSGQEPGIVENSFFPATGTDLPVYTPRPATDTDIPGEENDDIIDIPDGDGRLVYPG